MHLCCKWVWYAVTPGLVSVESYLVAGSGKHDCMLWGWDCWPGLRTRASSARFYFWTWTWLIWVFKVSSTFSICQPILSTFSAFMKLNIGYSVQCCKGLWQGHVPVKLTCPTSWGVLDQNVLKTGSDWREGGNFWTGHWHSLLGPRAVENGLTDIKNVLMKCFFIFTLESNTPGFLSFATNKNPKDWSQQVVELHLKNKSVCRHKSKFRGTKFYPINQVLLWAIKNTVILLTWIGAWQVEDPYILTGQILTTVCFIHYKVNPITTKL
jgi:hypothetical protein